MKKTLTTIAIFTGSLFFCQVLMAQENSAKNIPVASRSNIPASEIKLPIPRELKQDPIVTGAVVPPTTSSEIKKPTTVLDDGKAFTKPLTEENRQTMTGTATMPKEKITEAASIKTVSKPATLPTVTPLVTPVGSSRASNASPAPLTQVVPKQ